MSSNPESLPEPHDGEASPVADEAPAKPARKRRSPKAETAAAAPEASTPAAPEAAAELAVDAAEPAAPKKRRASAKRTTAAEAPLVEAAVEPAAPAPAESAPASEPAAVAAPVAAVGEPVAPKESEVSSGAARAEATLSAEAGDASEETEGERGGRNRRRNRRRGDKGDASGEPRAERAEGDAPRPQSDPALAAQLAGERFAEVLSGAFDVEEAPAAEPAAGDSAESAEAEPHKRVLAPEPDAPKLQKVLAQSGLGSRRDLEDMISEGRVTVNGDAAHIGQRVSFGDKIAIDGKPVKVRIVPPPPRIIAYHKPVGEVVTLDDPQQRPTVFRNLPRLQQGKWQSVGRLDINTEGLLLFTTSGELANQLMHPRFGVEREYAVRVLGQLDEQRRADLLEGVEVDGQTASFKSIDEGGGDGANRWYRVVITEGRNREVRKLFDAVGLTVNRLIRIRYGSVVLPRGLKRGVWVDLGPDDVRAIRRLAGGPPQGQPGPRNEQQGNRGGKQGKPRGNDRGQDRGPQNRGPERGRNGPPQGQPQQRRQEPREPNRDVDFDDEDDFDPARIPNPLEQTFDKRFVQNPRNRIGRAFAQGGGGFGPGGSAAPPSSKQKGGGPKQPDPLQTAVGYIGADAFHRKGGRGGRGGGGGGGGNRGGGGGGGGFGGGFGGPRRGR